MSATIFGSRACQKPNDLSMIVNSTFEDLRQFSDCPEARLYQGENPLNNPIITKVIPGEGALAGTGNIELSFSCIAFDPHNALFLCMAWEFHYRNDATRHMWSSGATPETNMPHKDVQTTRARRAAAHASEIDRAYLLREGEYVQPNGSSTDDRHILNMLYSLNELEKIGSSEQLIAQCIADAGFTPDQIKVYS